MLANSADIERLEKEVGYLQDEYARMNKRYEDLFYNLDYDNFGTVLLNDMGEFSLTAKKMTWLVEDGDDASSFTLTSKFAELIAENITLTGYVTFNDLETEGSVVIHGGNITAGFISADYIQGGTLTGVKINVFEDVRVGNNLYMLGVQNSPSGIIFGALSVLDTRGYISSGARAGVINYFVVGWKPDAARVEFNANGSVDAYGSWDFKDGIYGYATEDYVDKAIADAIAAHELAYH